MPSQEYIALKQLHAPPPRSTAGDMWLCRRLGIVKVFNGHKRGTRKGTVHNNFHLYHWGKPAMWSSPCDWRDNDPGIGGADDPAFAPTMGESWEYIGNIFQILPYEQLLKGKP